LGGGFHDALFGEVGTGEFGGESAFAEDEDAIAEGHEFGEFAGSDYDAEALFAEFVNEGVDFGFGSDIDAARGVVEEEDVGLSEEPASDDSLLLVSAAEAGDGSVDAGGFDAHAVDGVTGGSSLQ